MWKCSASAVPMYIVQCEGVEVLNTIEYQPLLFTGLNGIDLQSTLECRRTLCRSHKHNTNTKKQFSCVIS